MIKRSITSLLCLFLFFTCYSQSDTIRFISGDTISKTRETVIPQNHPEQKVVLSKKKSVYTLKPGVDIPIIAIGTGFTLYATTKIYTKGASTEEQINNLNISNINSFDRWAVTPYSQSLDKFSYIPFNASFAFPLVMLLVRDDTRHDFWKISFLYWEALSITGLFGAGAPYYIDRYRPYTYDITGETSMEQRQVQNAKNSAFSGHVEVIATSTFFIAKVYSDYYPDTKLIMYGLASVLTGGMAYIRLAGGMHFPSDVLIGTAIGTLSGILVPHFHKTKSSKVPDISILPYSIGDTKGLVLTYKFK